MRFITEFMQDETAWAATQRQMMYEEEFGRIIADSFGWQNPVNDNREHYRLEIEAFPMDKWIEFEKRFMDALPQYDAVSRDRLMNAFLELQKPTKPAGAAKELH